MTNTEKPTTKVEGKKESVGANMKNMPTKQKLENTPLKKTETNPQKVEGKKTEKKEKAKQIDRPKKT